MSQNHTHLSCPGCGKSLKVREEFLGRTIQCKHCDHRFVAEAPTERSADHVIPWPDRARTPESPPDDVEPLRARIASLESDLAALGTELSRAVADREEFRKQNQQLAQDLAELGPLRERVAALQIRVEQASHTEAQLRAQLADSERSTTEARELREASVALTTERDQARAEADRLRADLGTIQAERGVQAQQFRDEAARLGSERDEVRNDAERLRADLSTAQSERDELRREHESALAAAQSETAGLREDHERKLAESLAERETALVSATSSWEAERRELLDRLADRDRIASEHAGRGDQLAGRIVSLEEESTRLSGEFAAFRDQAGRERDALQAELSSTREAEERARGERDAAASERDETVRAREALSAAKVEAEEARRLGEERLKAEINRILRERDEANERVASAARRLGNLESEVESLRSNAREAEGSSEGHRAEVEASSRRAEEAEAAARESARRAEALESEIASLRESAAARTDTPTPSGEAQPDKAQLSSDLEDARRDLQAIRASLVNMGIRLFE